MNSFTGTFLNQTQYTIHKHNKMPISTITIIIYPLQCHNWRGQQG